jgi:hypothetical protein
LSESKNTGYWSSSNEATASLKPLKKGSKMNKFTKDQKVRDCYGETLTVMFQRGNMVMTYEKGLVHITKLFPDEVSTCSNTAPR